MQTFLSYLSASLQGLYSSDEIRMISRELLCRICQYPENEVLRGKDIKISTAQYALLQKAVQRLQQSEPLQYVTGWCSFYDLDFKMAPPVLIPRPETEELVDWILKDLTNQSAAHVLDVGTGSGCIAVTLAKFLPNSQVEAWDILPEALSLAQENAKRHQVKVSIEKMDLFQANLPTSLYEVIVSNPPYVCQSEKKAMDRNVLDYESPLALFVPDEDALRYYRALAELSMKSLQPSGCLYLEINSRFGKEMQQLLSQYFEEVTLRKDISGRDRMIRAASPKAFDISHLKAF